MIQSKDNMSEYNQRPEWIQSPESKNQAVLLGVKTATLLVRLDIPIQTGSKTDFIEHDRIDQVIIMTEAGFDSSECYKMRFGTLKNLALRDSDYNVLHLRHELLHPFAMKILQELFPNAQFTNFGHVVEDLTIALQNVVFYDPKNPIIAPSDSEPVGQRINYLCDYLISIFIANSIKSNPTFLESIKETVNNLVLQIKSSEYKPYIKDKENTEDFIFSYDFSAIDIDLIRNQSLENIQLFMDNFDLDERQFLKDFDCGAIIPGIELAKYADTTFYILGSPENILEWYIKP